MPLGDKLKLARSFLGKTQEEMGRTIGKSKRGWQTYEEGSAIPGGNVFEELVKLGFNINWFFSDGVPMLLEEISEDQHATKENLNLSPLPSDNLGLGESVELLAKIYNSGNKVLIRAIAANLHAFSESIDNRAMAQKSLEMMGEMNKRMLSMENKLAKLEEENKQLKKDPPQEDQILATG